jgi:hypothetical protein
MSGVVLHRANMRSYTGKAMRILFARFLLVFAVLGLPLQAVASVTMSLCDRDQHQGAGADKQSQDKASHCAHTGQPPCSGVAGDTVLCHYCAVAALPTVSSALASTASSVRTPANAPHLFLFFPELLKRPPVA